MKTLVLAIGNAGSNIVEKICRKIVLSELRCTQYVFADCDETWFKNVKKLLIIVGLGGNTGTKFVELAVRTAKNVGIHNVTVVATTPFSFEGKYRLNLAAAVAKQLSVIDGVEVVIFNNEKLLKKYSDLNFFNAFETADKEILDVIENLKQQHQSE